MAKKRENGGTDPTIEALDLTPERVSLLVETNEHVRVIRSGFSPNVVANFVRTIGEACEKKKKATHIQIILPRVDNPDIEERCSDFGATFGTVAEVRSRLTEWCKQVRDMQLKERLRRRHRIELRQTHRAHRHHAFAGENELYLGIAWHMSPSMVAPTMRIRRDSSFAGIFAHFDDDFDRHWRELDSEECIRVAELTSHEQRVLRAMYDLEVEERKLGMSVRMVQKKTGLNSDDAGLALRKLTDWGYVKYLQVKLDPVTHEWVHRDGSIKHPRGLTKIGIEKAQQLMQGESDRH